MKQTGKKLFGLLLLALTLSMLLGMSSMAASMKYEGDGIYSYSGSQEGVYVKLKVNKPSMLTVTGASKSSYGSTYGLSVALYNSSRKLVDTSSSSYVNASNKSYRVYGVKKGTYYIKVTSSIGDNYLVMASLKAMGDKGGSKKAKAYKMKSGKNYMGVLAAGESGKKEDWYKLTLPRKKVLTFYAGVEGNGSVKFMIYGPSYPRGTYVTRSSGTGEYYSTINGSRGAIKAGTYYVCIKRVNTSPTVSAAYSFKWK